MMEMLGPHGYFTISQISELTNFSKMPGRSRPVRHSEEVSRKSDGEDVKWLTWMVSRFTGKGHRRTYIALRNATNI
jgi:hypothetical protein